MGFDEERFISVVADTVKCVLCQGILDNPVKTKCGHVYCSGCILSWMVYHESCPYGCGRLSNSDIQDDLGLREFIFNMKVHCNYRNLGCIEKIRLKDLQEHDDRCAYKVVCSSKDVSQMTMKLKDLEKDGNDGNFYCAVNVCQKGCGMVFNSDTLESHDCFASLRAYIAEQENRVNTIETQMKRLSSAATRKEKFLLTQVLNLHNKLQLEAIRYKRKLNDYKSQLDNEDRQNANQTYHTDNVEKTIEATLILERRNNSLGFHIMGGYTPEQNNNKRNESDEEMTGEIIVSRVIDGSPASNSGLKKDDQIVKVNGQDLSQATHEEAVEAFRAAKEPIVVEVLRRVNKNKMKSRPPAMVSIGTQTEEDIYGYDRPPTPPPPIFAFNPSGLYQPGTRRPVAFSPSTEMGLTDIEMAHGLDYDDPYFDDRPYEMEYEEVILHRAANDQKLGLTLCYGSLEDETTDIFISEVESCSISAQDGRIREGDQILQINGVDVHSRDQAIKLFSERGSDIKLLLARPQLQLDDGFMEDQNVTLDDLHMDILEKHHRDNMQIMASMLARGHIDEEGGTTDTATTENSLHKHEKDSGVGRTDESTKNDESSEQDVFDTECTNSPAATTKFRSHKISNQTYSDESLLSNEVTDHDMIVNDISMEDCDKFRQHLERRCNDNSLEGSPRKDLTRKDSQSSIERELAILNKEMENIHLECQEMCNRHQKDENKLQREGLPIRSPRIVPRMGTRLEYLKYVQIYDPTNSWDKKDTMPKLGSQNSKSQSEKDASTTTSAYNTGESCRSTPLTLELNQGSDEGERGFKNSMLCLAPTNMPSLSDTEKQTQTPCRSSQDCSSDENVLSMTTENTEAGSLKKQSCMGESLQDLYMKYADVMYTNQANLQHTIAIQQKLFQQQIDQKQVRSNRSRTSTGSPFPSSTGSPTPVQQAEHKSGDSPNVTPPDSSGQMEWVVKRRPDGTRYITRRPVRSKMLKERAKKISEERCGMTTDDDAMSELKFGRYWSKEERKKHIEKARDHKRKREGMMRAKMETLKEAEEKKELNIVELSHRKMMKHKGKKVFDDFVTVQEMLAHGSRVLEGKTYNPLLSVTTV